MSGALVENIYYGFWAKGSLTRFLIKNVFGKVFVQPQIPKHVYLSAHTDSAHKLLGKYNLILEN